VGCIVGAVVGFGEGWCVGAAVATTHWPSMAGDVEKTYVVGACWIQPEQLRPSAPDGPTTLHSTMLVLFSPKKGDRFHGARSGKSCTEKYSVVSADGDGSAATAVMILP